MNAKMNKIVKLIYLRNLAKGCWTFFDLRTKRNVEGYKGTRAIVNNTYKAL